MAEVERVPFAAWSKMTEKSRDKKEKEKKAVYYGGRREEEEEEEKGGGGGGERRLFSRTPPRRGETLDARGRWTLVAHPPRLRAGLTL